MAGFYPKIKCKLHGIVLHRQATYWRFATFGAHYARNPTIRINEDLLRGATEFILLDRSTQKPFGRSRTRDDSR
jgi:hypothetical protein